MAQKPGRLEKIILNTEYNSEGIFAFKFYIRGLPTVVTIDDYLPFSNN